MRRKDVEGCLIAADRKEWSVRKKETRLRGDPLRESQGTATTIVNI